MGSTNEAAKVAGMTPDGPLAPERLHARYAPRIRRQIRALFGADDEHDDLVQDVLIAIITKVSTVRDLTCLDWWVAQVTTNTVKQVVRRRRVRSHAPLEEDTEVLAPAVPADFQARELVSRALAVMVSLPLNDRALLTSYWLSPATAETIAAEVGCSVVTVRRRLSRAQARFERLARRDPALARCIDDARSSSRRWHSAPNDNPSLVPTNRRVWHELPPSLVPRPSHSPC